jgi:hypothetical protein
MGFGRRLIHYHRLTPLYRLMTSRYGRGYAFTAVPAGWELNPYGYQVVKVQFSVPCLAYA